MLLQGYRCQYRGLKRRQSTATSLISCTLILIATWQLHAAAAVVHRSATTTTTGETVATRQTAGYVNPAKYDSEASTNYYRTRAGDGNEQMTTTATYANYFAAGNYGAEEDASGELITRDNLAALRAATRTNEFMPTTLTAAGQHYAAEAGKAIPSANNAYALLLGESFKLPTGDKIDYDEINAQNFERARGGSSSSSRAYDAIEQQHQQEQQQQSDDELRDYFTYAAEHEPTLQRQQQYLRDYQRQKFSNYQQHDASDDAYGSTIAANYALNANGEQQQQQQLRLSATPTLRALNYAQQQQVSDQQATAPSQLQLHVSDSIGRSILPPLSSSAENDVSNGHEGARRSSHYYYQHAQQPSHDLDFNSNHLDSNLQHMQQQLQQQQQHFAQLQLQLQQHDLQLQQQTQLHTQQQHHHQLSPQLPAITKTVHHTPASAAAIAGIPLAKHVHVTKQVPTVTHYQQQHVPYKHNVPIEIPKPVITTVPRPYPIHIPMTKTVAVPQMKEVKIPIEKIKPFPVERNVPYIVERRVPYRVEKQVAKPYYYPYPIKVPVVKTIVHRAPATSSHHHSPHHHQHHLEQLHYQPHNSHVLHTTAGLYGGGALNLG